MDKKDLRTGKYCYYCYTETEQINGKLGKMQKCPNCEAYVSIDISTGAPAGCTADNNLRQDRRLVHHYSSILIKRKMKRDNIGKALAKRYLYEWLSKEINLDFNMVSIAQLFPLETSNVIKILKKYI